MNKRTNKKKEKAIEVLPSKRTISESNRVGFLKKSKKYAQGKEYNTLEGRIKIINRYLENGEIMISYLNMKTDKIVIANELDVNSLLYRYATDMAKKAQGEELAVRQGKYLSEEVHALRSESEALEEALANAKSENLRLSTELARQQLIIDQQFDLISALMGRTEVDKPKRG